MSLEEARDPVEVVRLAWRHESRQLHTVIVRAPRVVRCDVARAVMLAAQRQLEARIAAFEEERRGAATEVRSSRQRSKRRIVRYSVLQRDDREVHWRAEVARVQHEVRRCRRVVAWLTVDVNGRPTLLAYRVQEGRRLGEVLRELQRVRSSVSCRRRGPRGDVTPYGPHCSPQCDLATSRCSALQRRSDELEAAVRSASEHAVSGRQGPHHSMLNAAPHSRALPAHAQRWRRESGMSAWPS